MNILKEKGFQAIVIISVLIICSIFYSWYDRDSELNKGSRFTIIEIEKKQYFDNGDPMAHF